MCSNGKRSQCAVLESDHISLLGIATRVCHQDAKYEMQFEFLGFIKVKSKKKTVAQESL